MTPEELKTLQDTIQMLQESGMLEQLVKTGSEPGSQTALVYTLISLVVMLSFRVIVVNKIFEYYSQSLAHRKQLEQDFQEGLGIFKRVEGFLESISDKLICLQQGQEEEKSRLSNLYALLVGRRSQDQPITFYQEDKR